MKSVGRRRLVILVYGMTLSALFLYPLLEVLDSSIYYFHWQQRDTWELAAAFVVLSILFAVVLSLLRRIRNPRALLICTLALCWIPLMSFAAGTSRHLPRSSIQPLIDELSLWRVQFASAALFLVLSATLLVPARLWKLLRRLALVLVPLNLVFLFWLVRLAGYVSHPTTVGLDGKPPGDTTPAGAVSCKPSVFIFLFDEMSYRFIYEHGVVRASLPQLKRFSDHATNYHRATAPGGKTEQSLPGLLAVRRFADISIVGDTALGINADGSRVSLDVVAKSGLFGAAKANGLRTEMFGSFFPYCRMLAGVVDACQSFSLYNYSTGVSGFSIIHPIMSTIVMWPYQFPFGVLKVPAFGVHQRHIVERTIERALGDLRPNRPRFRFVHLNVPHLPFVFDANGYHPAADPMLQNAANYERQMQYVDAVLGKLVDGLQKAAVFDTSTVVLMADHEYRASVLLSEWPHVPFIVKRPGQTTREDVDDPVQCEILIKSLVSAAGTRR